jgi:hypothetical protein
MKSRQMALCGLLTALAVVFMVLASAIGIGTFAGPLLAMIALLPLLEEYGSKTALAAYAAAAVLGFLIAPELELSLVFAAFGWYPVLRPKLNRLTSRPVRLLIKVVICVAVILTLYGVLLNLLGMTADLVNAAPLLNLFLLILGVFTFLMMDLALERATFLWHKKFRKWFFR